jgi:mRNA interferase HigB
MPGVPMLKTTIGDWGRAKVSADRALGQIRAFAEAVKILNASRVRFAILGGNYRLITEINYVSQVVYIRFIGTHADYDKVDARAVKDY